MARMKKPADETNDEMVVRQLLETIANHATRSEKTSWQRKRDNMDKLVKQLRPLEDEMIAIRSKMIPIYDEVSTLRTEMVLECIHPFDMLIHKEDHVECKFCSAKLRVPTPGV